MNTSMAKAALWGLSILLLNCNVYSDELLSGPAGSSFAGGGNAEDGSGHGGGGGSDLVGQLGGAGSGSAESGAGGTNQNPIPDAGTAGVDARASDGEQDRVSAASPDAHDAADDFPDVRDGVVNESGPKEAAPDVAPCPGYAIALSGNSHITVTRPVAADFTLEAWIKTSSSLSGTSASQGRGVLFADASGSNNDFATSVLTNRFAFSVGNPDITIQSMSNVATGQWVHVAATRQESTGQIQVFVNGTLESTGTSGNRGPLDNPTTLLIGGGSVAANDFIGQIDEVRAWNVVRTAQQITATMHQRLTGAESGLVAYWRMDEPGVVPDSSGANNGVVVGSPAWVQPDAVCSP
jgi:hypothetical protein